MLSWKYFVPLLLAGTLSGCTTARTPGPVTITKVNPFHLNESNTDVSSADPMLNFEPRRRLHGAVDLEEYEDRYGNYFTVFWKSENKTPATVRLEYRQAASGSKVLSREVSVPTPKRSNTTELAITGDEYHKGGKVTQWKVSILEAGATVAESKSFLWKE